MDILRQEIAKNLAKGIVEEAEHEEGEWISNVFLVPKKAKDGKPAFRMILDLNEFIKEYPINPISPKKIAIPQVTIFTFGFLTKQLLASAGFCFVCGHGFFGIC